MAGTSHRMRNVPCQDVFRCGTFGPSAEWLAVAVSDGAGSAAHSEVGAALVSAELLRRAELYEPAVLATRDGMIELFTAARNALILEAQARDVRPRELACTAILALVGPDSATFAQLGDGVIVLGGEPECRTVFWPEPTEYANTTDFLTDERFADLIRFETTPGLITELAVLTDGLQRLALDFTAHKPYQGFFRPFFDRLRAESDPEALREPFREFLNSPRVNDRTDDDKTLVLAVRRP
jgi:hypothetical protein